MYVSEFVCGRESEGTVYLTKVKFRKEVLKIESSV